MATWNTDVPDMDHQVSDDIESIRENLNELKDIVEAITTGTVGTTEPAAFAVDVFLGTYFAMAEATNADFDTGTTTVDSIAHASYRGCAWLYAISGDSGASRRVGLFLATWASGGATIYGSDAIATTDIGTVDVTLDADVSGADVRLRATATSDNWSIQLLRFAAVA